MDQDVLSALARWPDVPAAYGWLSLDGRGKWHFHPQGASADGGPGESITNTQILAFIDRNYERDDAGRWFFQNGPQRVYLRLDVAPLILRYSDDKQSLVAHTGKPCGAVLGWWLDDAGRLFAQTKTGPGVIDDRDLMAVLADMRLEQHGTQNGTIDPGLAGASDGDALLDAMARLQPGDQLKVTHPCDQGTGVLTGVKQGDLATRLGFDPAPSAPSSGDSGIEAGQV